MITKENIEAYLLDFLEGNLSADELLELETFLAENPTYNSDFELLQLEQDHQLNFNKESLKKNPIFEPIAFQEIQDGTLVEKMLVAASENVLSETEMVHFNNHIAENLVTQREFEMYQKTRLSADNNIVFPNLSRLKRKNTKVFLFNSMLKWSAAASVIGICFWLIFGSNSMPGNVVAKKIQVSNNRKDTIIPKVVKPNQPVTENAAIFNLNNPNRQQILPPKQTIDSSTASLEFSTNPNLIANVNSILANDSSLSNAPKNEMFPGQVVTNTSAIKEKSITFFEFVNSKLKKRFFGEENPSPEKMYASISNKISFAAGISFTVFNRVENGRRSFQIRIGKFSLEKN